MELGVCNLCRLSLPGFARDVDLAQNDLDSSRYIISFLE